MLRTNNYADRFKPPIDDLASMCSNRSDQDEHSLLRSKKLSLETNRRRRDLAERKRHEADLEALRRQEILEKRREKLKEATEKYQRGGKPRKRANSANHSKSMRQLSSKQLENTLRLVYGDNPIPLAGSLYRSNSFDSVRHYAFADSALPKQEHLVVIKNNQQPTTTKANIQSGIQFVLPATQSGEEKSHLNKTPFESKLDRHQQRLLEEQDRNLRRFSEALQDVLQDENVSDASSDSLDEDLCHTYDKYEDNAEDGTIAGSLILDDILDTGLFIEKKRETVLRATDINLAGRNQNTLPESTSRFVVQTLSTKLIDSHEANEKSAAPKASASSRIMSAGILKKNNANINENFHVSGITSINQSEKKNKYEALRDSIEVSRGHLVSFRSEGDLTNGNSNVVLQKKSVRFASQLCNEAPTENNTSTETKFDVDQDDCTSNKPFNIPRYQSTKHRTNPNNASQVPTDPHNSDYGLKNKTSCARGKPPPHPSTTAPAVSEPGYAELVRKPPPVFRSTLHRAPRPERITSDMLSRVAAAASGTAAQPLSSQSKRQVKQHRYTNGNSPILTRCASDSNIFATLGEADASQNHVTPIHEQLQSRKTHLNSDDPIDYNLEKTPTDQEIDWLWEKVRSCLHRSNGSLAGDSQAPSDISIQSAPSRTALSLVPHVIDGTSLYTPNRVDQSRVVGSNFQMQHNYVQPQQRRMALLKQRVQVTSPILSTISQKPPDTTWNNDIEDKPTSSVTDSLNEFLSAEQQCSSSIPNVIQFGGDSSIATKNRHELLASAKLSAGRKGVILRTGQPTSTLTVYSPHPPPNKDSSSDSIPRANSERLRSTAPSQLSLEEARLMKSLDRLNDKLKNKS